MRISVLGRSEALYGVLEKIVTDGHQVTSIVSPKEAPEYSKTSDDFKKFATDMRIPFSSKANMVDLREVLVFGNPEIGVSMNFPIVISSEVIDSVPLGILNIHGGDLPRYRGNACQAWAILNGEEKVGLCVHKMEGNQLDSGDIISRDFFQMSGATSITEVHEWLVNRSPHLVAEALERLGQDPSFVLEKQTESVKAPLRTFPRRPEDGRIDWHQSSEQIVRLIKASSRPYRGAFCFLDQDEVVIWDAAVENVSGEFLAVPGQIMSVSQDSIIVACGHGAIRVTDWHLAGDQAVGVPVVKSIRQRLT